MKKLLIVLPLLLTACSSIQLKNTEQQHNRTMIHVQPTIFDAVNTDRPINIFRCFAPGDVDGELCRADILRNIDRGQLVTVSYVQDGDHWIAEGTLRDLVNNKLKLEEHFNVYLTVSSAPYPITAFEYINTADIEYVVVDGSGELK